MWAPPGLELLTTIRYSLPLPVPLGGTAMVTEVGETLYRAQAPEMIGE